jgi:hypothetical protein
MRKVVLEWKFFYYDSNSNDDLSSIEQSLFQQDIHSYIYCSSFFDHFSGLIDANNDGVLRLDEWRSFFDGETPHL